MLAIDTNVAARFVMGDEPDQAAEAASVLAGGVYLPITVLMELGWLLGSRYALSRGVIADTLADLVDLASVHVADAAGVGWAISRYAAGADLADMLHLISAAPAERFATFDRGIETQAGPDAPVPIAILA